VERDPVDLEALARRAVDDPAAEVARDRGHHLGLVGAQHALDHLRTEHEVPVVGVVRVEAVPLEEADVVGVQRFPALARGAEELREYDQTVRRRLDAFDLAHGVLQTVQHSVLNRIGIKKYLLRPDLAYSRVWRASSASAASSSSWARARTATRFA